MRLPFSLAALVVGLAGCQFIQRQGGGEPSLATGLDHVPQPVAAEISRPGVVQLLDPDTGQTYYARCDPCLRPTPKTMLPPIRSNRGPQAPLTAVPPAPAPRLHVVAPSPAVDATAPLAPDARPPTAVPAQPAAAMVPPPVRAASPPPMPGPAESTAPKAALAVRCVPFAFGSAALSQEAQQAIATWVAAAKAAKRVHIRAYTSSIPGHSSPRANEVLAAARAAKIRHYLVSSGVPTSAISTSYCTGCFIDQNDTDGGRQANRQALVVLSPTMDLPALAAMDIERRDACRSGEAKPTWKR